MESRKKWYRRSYLQSGAADIGNKHKDTKGGKWGGCGELGDGDSHIHITMYKVDVRTHCIAQGTLVSAPW